MLVMSVSVLFNADLDKWKKRVIAHKDRKYKTLTIKYKKLQNLK